MFVVSRRRPQASIGPIEAAISFVVIYVVAALLIPFTVWLLFLWQRPDDPGGAMIYEALESGFWRAVWWLLLVIKLIPSNSKNLMIL